MRGPGSARTATSFLLPFWDELTMEALTLLLSGRGWALLHWRGCHSPCQFSWSLVQRQEEGR